MDSHLLFTIGVDMSHVIIQSIASDPLSLVTEGRGGTSSFRYSNKLL